MYVRLAVIAVVFVVGWGLGDKLSSGRYEAELRNAADMYRIAQDAALARASEEAKVESKRAVRAAEERGRRSVATREIINEIHLNPDNRDCDWTDEHRLRVERIYSNYDADTGASD